MKRQYFVEGMNCAACQGHVEKAVSAVAGVESCTVSLLTNSMQVDGTASPSSVIQAVQNAGYGAKEKSTNRSTASESAKLQAEEDALTDRETPLLKRRLVYSIDFLLLLMYISMGHHMLGWPLPAFLNHNVVALGMTQMILAAVIMIINEKFFISGYRSLFSGTPNMDTLVALGSSVSFGWSVYILYRLTGMMADKASMELMMKTYSSELYFESAAMIPTLITLGKMLEARSKGKTTSALKGLMKLAPKTAVLIRNGEEVTVGIDEVLKGDLFAVRPGEQFPVDGIILEGNTTVNESALTGESIPVDKTENDHVSAGTINETGYLKCRAERVGADTTLSQIINMVSEAAATRAPIARTVDRVSAVFVPAVMMIAAATVIGWLVAGQTAAIALEHGISVLVISCPCALGLATPVAIMVGNGRGATAGILFKTSEALENTGRTQIVALDKTGTVTSGIPEVTDVIPSEGISREQLLNAAVSLESKSEHPLSKAIMKLASAEHITGDHVTDFKALPGTGLSANRNGIMLFGGSLASVQKQISISPEMLQQCDYLSSLGRTPLLFMEANRLLGMIAVADAIRPESKDAIAQLKQMGITAVMITGDSQRTAEAIGKEVGIDLTIAGVLPQGKQQVIKLLQKHGRTAMVGDGINDAPALTASDTGIAIGAGTDVAIDAADVVLVKSRLSDVPAAIHLSRQVLKNIRENLFWAFFYNVICIPLAAGLFAWKLNPMIAAAAMSLSSVTVVSNSLRLNLLHLDRMGHGHPLKQQVSLSADEFETELNKLINPTCPISQEEKSDRSAVLKIGGMMCEHCEKQIRTALMKVDGVTAVLADHHAGQAVIQMNRAVDEKDLKAAVQAAGYEYAGIGRMENMSMTRTIKIEGMRCEHCEASVKKALEQIQGVERAAVSRTSGTAVVTLSSDVSNDVMKQAVEAEDFQVVSID